MRAASVKTALLSLAMLSACRPAPANSVVQKTQNAALSLSEAPSLSLEVQLGARQNQIRTWARICNGIAAKGNCEVGDAALFNGILCLSGEAFACDAVRHSQDIGGRMWRAPGRMGHDAEDSFSRDMTLGVLAYLVGTHDRQLAAHWLAWIRQNGGDLCPIASDNRCTFTPGLWNLFKHVWQGIGFSPTDEMLSELYDDELLLALQSQFAPTGFQLHLLGVNLLIRKKLGRNTFLTRLAASNLAEREPGNAFFVYLRDGATENVARSLLSRCPAERPREPLQWSYEREDSQQAWEDSMGWDCIAMIDFWLKDTGR